eukprot:6003426-Pyramimonas_sp.AAC.1
MLHDRSPLSTCGGDSTCCDSTGLLKKTKEMKPQYDQERLDRYVAVLNMHRVRLPVDKVPPHYTRSMSLLLHMSCQEAE